MTTKPQSPIHAPLDDVEPKPAPPTRIALLASLDHRVLSGTPRSLGAGGLEKATREDLIDGIRILDEQAANAGKAEDQVSRIITDLSGPMIRSERGKLQ